MSNETGGCIVCAAIKGLTATDIMDRHAWEQAWEMMAEMEKQICAGCGWPAREHQGGHPHAGAAGLVCPGFTQQQTYSVLLLYPDYHADFYGETFFESATAASVDDAVAHVRASCMESESNWNDEDNESFIVDPDDLAVLLVIAGDHQDIKHLLRMPSEA